MENTIGIRMALFKPLLNEKYINASLVILHDGLELPDKFLSEFGVIHHPGT